MCDWVCYLITSLESNKTYIGASNNQPKRLRAHNRQNPAIRRTGARATSGQTWTPVLIVSGFPSKTACLSFETGWRRLASHRRCNHMGAINTLSHICAYQKSPTHNRCIDLLYFMHYMVIRCDTDGTKYRLDRMQTQPPIYPNNLHITAFANAQIADMPWPVFVQTSCI